MFCLVVLMPFIVVGVLGLDLIRCVLVLILRVWYMIYFFPAYCFVLLSLIFALCVLRLICLVFVLVV